jgi:chromosome segregation ATPase
MLEKKDLEMIAEIMKEINKPINERLDKIDSRLDQMDSRLDQMDSRLDQMDSRLDQMDSRLDQMDSRLDQMDSRLNKLESKVTEVQMTLENETNKEIRIIAEGHLDLSRKLDDALKVENEKEMLLLRVTRLENELRRLKQKIEEIA